MCAIAHIRAHIHMCAMTHTYVCYGSYTCDICVLWFIYVLIYVCVLWLIYVLIYVCVLWSYTYVCYHDAHIRMCATMTHLQCAMIHLDS